MRPIPEDWRGSLRPETEASYFRDLRDFVERERSEHQVFPPEEDVFRALELTPPDAVRVVILDQDRHTVLEAPHPSPQSAWRGFLGSRPFSKVNAALKEAGREEVDWSVIAD